MDLLLGHSQRFCQPALGPSPGDAGLDEGISEAGEGCGSGAVSASARHPLVLAGFGATMQAINGPRLVIGLGRGDVLWYGASSYEGFVDTARILKRLWSGETIDYEGPAGRFHNLKMDDKLEDVPPPKLWYFMLGGGPKAAKAAADPVWDGVALPKTDPEIQALGRAIGLYEREFRFYSQLSGRVMGRVPLCFFAGDGDIGERPLLLEDLTAFHTVDQIGGFSLRETEQVVDHLARMHAGFWDSPVLLDPDLGWLSAFDQPAFVKGLAGAVAGAVEPFEARYADRLPRDAFRAALRAAADTVEILGVCAAGPHTLVHFDPRADNWLFDDDCSPCLLDWQAVGRVRGLHDVAYVLCGSVPPDIQEQHWEALLRRYHDRLSEHGVSGYLWPDCREHYRQHVGAVTLLMLPMIGLIKSERGERLADAIIGRCVPHALAVGAFG